MTNPDQPILERKFCATEAAIELTGSAEISGYASLFGRPDQGGDIVGPGAYDASLKRFADTGRRVKMLWQHDPMQPIGIWEEVRADATGLFVKGRLLQDVARGREAAALIAAGAIEGLSIGYRTRRAERDPQGRRLLTELELWEVSLVTFPMLAEARVGSKAGAAQDAPPSLLGDLAEALDSARRDLTRG